MELYDTIVRVSLPLSVIYDQLMELDSMESKIDDKIDSTRLQSMRAKFEYEESITDAEDGTGESYQKIIHDLEQLKGQVARKHGHMRKVANAYSRSRICSLNILDLPDELLRMIFEKSRD